MNENNNIITFIDHIGRTIIGELADKTPTGEETDDVSFYVKNPAILHVQPTQQGQLNVQTIPLYFRDFVSDKNKEDGTYWKFHYHNTVIGVGVENDPRLIEQYVRIFANTPVIQPVTQTGGGSQEKTIKLFDD